MHGLYFIRVSFLCKIEKMYGFSLPSKAKEKGELSQKGIA